MDPLSVSASVIALLQLTSTVLGYLSDVKEGPKELQRIRLEISSVLSLLIMLQDQADQAIQGDMFSSSLNSLNVSNGPFQQFHSALDRLASKLAPVEGWRKVGKAFKWPFEKEEMLEILNTIERLKALFNLARQNDHIALSKAVKGDIETLHDRVHEISLGVTNLRHDNKHKEIRRWLSAPDPSSNYNRALKHRHARSGDWFLKSDAYMDWLSGSSSLLWLYGIPGCGKTILGSAIIQETITYCGSRSKSVVLYFYFDFNDTEKQLHEQMIRSLISQLFVHCATVPSVLEMLYSSCMDGERQPSAENLLTALHQIMASFEETHIILDALDECGDRPELLMDLQDIFDWKDVNCRMLVISRREKDIEDGLMSSIKQAGTLCIHSALIDADIRQYIHDRLQSDRELKKWQKEQFEIEDALMHKASGMFRWAACQLDTLCTCRSVLQLRKALRSLPETLDKTYDRILGKIDGEDYQFALQILRWLAFSGRPLDLKEIAEVITIDAKKSPHVDTDKRFKDPRDILEICSSLISVEDVGTVSHTTTESNDYKDAEEDGYDDDDDDGDVDTETSYEEGRWPEANVRLAHYSVKEYLVSERIRHGPATDYGLQEADSNESMAEECLVYLLHVIKPDVWAAMSLSQYPLATYAAEYWIEHIQFMKSAASTALALVKELFLSKDESFVNWIQIHSPDQSSPYLSSWKSGSPLYYASFLGLLESVVALLEDGADCNVKGGKFGYPLTAASRSGHIEIVQLLLDKGAKVNASIRGYISTALVAASSKGHIEIVQLLLNKGARKNVRWGENALTAALQADQEKTALLLVEKGAGIGASRGTFLESLVRLCSKELFVLILDKAADVSAQPEVYSTALKAACSLGREEIVQLLLAKGAAVNPPTLHAALRKGGHVLQMLFEHGADLNQKDTEGKAVCHYASACGDIKTLEILMSRGSDISITDKQGRNCLHFAFTCGYDVTVIVTMLLKHGFDPNALDCHGWSPLHWAAKCGNTDVIAILEDAGAKISIETMNGWTPEDVATFHGREVTWTSNSTSGINVAKGPEHSAICDSCDQNIWESRYKCLDCEDYDYCLECKPSSDETHPGHRFIKDPTPAQLRELWDEEEAAEALEEHIASASSETGQL